MKPAPLNSEDIRKVLRGFGESLTFPAEAYLSPDVLAWERENLWQATWNCVGRLDELLTPGQLRAVEVGGEGVLLSRDTDGSLHAFSNVCRHRGHELAPIGDAFDARQIRCPYHSWSYRFDGSLRTAPKFTQSIEFDTSDYPLIDLGVAVYGGWVWIDLSGTAPDIVEHFGNLAEIAEPYETDRLTTAATHSYVVEANWKTIVENYNECLHCPVIHPELVQVVPLFRFGEVWDGETRDGGNDMMDGARSFTMTGRSELPTFPDLPDEDLTRYYGAYQFPNLLLNVHPDCVMYYIGYPKGPDHTTVVSEYLFRPETIADPDAFKPEPVVELWDLISKQDWDVCERAQTGVGSRSFTSGVYPRQDRFLFDFNERYRRQMGRPLLG